MTTEEQLKSAKAASIKLRTITTEQKNVFLNTLADLLVENIDKILLANKKDLESVTDLTPAMKKRLCLTETGIKGIANGVREIVELPDPVGTITKMWKRPNGLEVGRMRVPIGVIFFIFESRPNVIVDASALCIKSGNVLIARGGKEAENSNQALIKLIFKALSISGLPEYAAQLLEDRAYSAISEVVKKSEYVDLVVPRGREELIQTIKNESRVPVIAHERGLCHLYIDSEADTDKAIKIAINAKTSNPSTCNTIETILVHEQIADKVMPGLISALIEKGVEVRGCERTCKYNEKCKLATDEDWRTEYLDLIISIKIVDSFDEAIEHIQTFSSGLTDSIMTENDAKAKKFIEMINSAAVLVNASNRFTDGQQFGLGAELGISTSSIHMKGPMGLEDLTVTKYIVFGNGQVRE